jgi:glycosyltransferase involved in cell wall biosynthesis
MKILYVVPNINNGDGISRVIAIKANYLIENYGYEIAILTQNNGHDNLFFEFNKKITFYDMQLNGTIFHFFNSFKNQLINAINEIKPDRIVICDNGLKAFLIPFIINPKIPLLLEIHSSLFIEESDRKNTFLPILSSKLICFFKQFGASQYNQVIVETQDSIEEWKVKKGIVIPNPLWFSTDIKSDLSQKNVIAVGRHAYEKGFDRLLEIWKKVIVKYPDWNLTIYGKSNPDFDLVALAKKLTIENNITFHEPVKNIEEKYLEASIYLMTSRFEGFGMVLIEAMASGLPCVAYDCPCGPRAIIENNSNGFLIEDGNENQFIQTLENLIENENLRIDMGNKAKISVNKYQIEAIMEHWNSILKGKIV